MKFKFFRNKNKKNNKKITEMSNFSKLWKCKLEIRDKLHSQLGRFIKITTLRRCNQSQRSSFLPKFLRSPTNQPVITFSKTRFKSKKLILLMEHYYKIYLEQFLRNTFFFFFLKNHFFIKAIVYICGTDLSHNMALFCQNNTDEKSISSLKHLQNEY